MNAILFFSLSAASGGKGGGKEGGIELRPPQIPEPGLGGDCDEGNDLSSRLASLRIKTDAVTNSATLRILFDHSCSPNSFTSFACVRGKFMQSLELNILMEQTSATTTSSASGLPSSRRGLPPGRPLNLMHRKGLILAMAATALQCGGVRQRGTETKTPQWPQK